MGVRGLGHKQCSHGDIQAASVRIENIAGGDHKAHDCLGASPCFPLSKQSRKRSLGRACAEYEYDFLLDIKQESQDVESRKPGNCSQDNQDKNTAAKVKRKDKSE